MAVRETLDKPVVPGVRHHRDAVMAPIVKARISQAIQGYPQFD
jgi:hypothetical protein